MAEKTNGLFSLPERDWLSVCLDSRLPLVVYGMGNGADKLEDRLTAAGLSVSDTIASDGFVRGQSFRGRRVLTYREAEEKYGDFLLLVAFGTRLPEVLSNIREMAMAHTVLIPDMPVAGEAYFDLPFAKAHESKLRGAYEALSDDTSREVFLSLLSSKITGDFDELMAKVQTKDSIFKEIPCENIKVAADFGAYNGDTVRELSTFADNLSCAIAAEPDSRSFKKLKAYAEEESRFRVVPVRAAVGGEGEASFYASGNRNSSLFHGSYENKSDAVPLLSVDGLLSGYGVDYLKMDVEGAELSALMTARDTIARCRPILKIAVYHRSEDLFAIPLYLRQNTTNYRLLLRRTPCIPAWEADIIAIPNEVTK